MKITFSEGSGLNDSIFGKCQGPIQMFLEQRGEQFEQQSVIKDLFRMGTSKNFSDTFTSMTWCHSSSVMSHSRPVYDTPALRISASTR